MCVCVRLMPAVLQTMAERKDLLSNEIYLLSAVTALQRVTETLPHFISPYLHATVSQVRNHAPFLKTAAPIENTAWRHRDRRLSDAVCAPTGAFIMSSFIMSSFMSE